MIERNRARRILYIVSMVILMIATLGAFVVNLLLIIAIVADPTEGHLWLRMAAIALCLLNAAACYRFLDWQLDRDFPA